MPDQVSSGRDTEHFHTTHLEPCRDSARRLPASDCNGWNNGLHILDKNLLPGQIKYQHCETGVTLFVHRRREETLQLDNELVQKTPNAVKLSQSILFEASCNNLDKPSHLELAISRD